MKMYHPDVADSENEVDALAFAQVWSGKGWLEVGAEETEAPKKKTAAQKPATSNKGDKPDKEDS